MWWRVNLGGELTGIYAFGREVEMLLGMKDGASGKLGLILGIELKLSSRLKIEVGIEVSENDGGDNGNSVKDGLEVGV